MLSIVQYITIIIHASYGVYLKIVHLLHTKIWLLFLNHNKKSRSIFFIFFYNFKIQGTENDDCIAYLCNCLMMLTLHYNTRILLEVFYELQNLILKLIHFNFCNTDNSTQHMSFGLFYFFCN